ncbi:hypothetical protein [Streptomyces sp. NPDC001828]|uniref:hypothetical protein n=1 Tax=Streptomyces sp. NPDC001828 TaxID=3364615 RepID=UPI0036ABB950
MTDHAPAPGQVCPNCDGFAAAAVTLGGRDRHGHRRTITAHCPSCHGTGRAPRRLVPSGSVGGGR